MEQMFELLVMSIGMFIITMGLGMMPSKLKTSKRTLDLISIFGAGLLVGAALIIIVPEGMTVLVDALIN